MSGIVRFRLVGETLMRVNSFLFGCGRSINITDRNQFLEESQAKSLLGGGSEHDSERPACGELGADEVAAVEAAIVDVVSGTECVSDGSEE